MQFTEAKLPGRATSLAIQIMKQTTWTLAEPISLLPGSSATPVIIPAGGMPTESMVFTKTVLPMQKQRGRDDMKCSTRETLDPNLQLDVVVQLVC